MESNIQETRVEYSHKRPNIQNYEHTYRNFSWDTPEQELDDLPNGRGANNIHEAVDRHAAGPSHQVALRWLGKKGELPVNLELVERICTADSATAYMEQAALPLKEERLLRPFAV
jgi:hypothetical protein